MHTSIHPLKRLGTARAVLAVAATACPLALAGPPSTAMASIEPAPASHVSDNSYKDPAAAKVPMPCDVNYDYGTATNHYWFPNPWELLPPFLWNDMSGTWHNCAGGRTDYVKMVINDGRDGSCQPVSYGDTGSYWHRGSGWASVHGWQRC